MKVYLASPFFKEMELDRYKQVVDLLRGSGDEIFIPQEHTIPDGDSLLNHEWARKVFEMDVAALDDSDLVMVLNWGLYSDSGTAWEQGYAYAKGKKILSILMDEAKETEYSLMTINGSHNCICFSSLMGFDNDYDFQPEQK